MKVLSDSTAIVFTGDKSEWFDYPIWHLLHEKYMPKGKSSIHPIDIVKFHNESQTWTKRIYTQGGSLDKSVAVGILAQMRIFLTIERHGEKLSSMHKRALFKLHREYQLPPTLIRELFYFCGEYLYLKTLLDASESEFEKCETPAWLKNVLASEKSSKL